MTLRIGTSITIGTHILPALLGRYQKMFPDLTIEASVSRSSVIETRILDNSMDIGLIENRPEHPDICFEPFMRDELCAIVPPAHPLADREPITMEELARYLFLMREKGSAGREILDACFEVRQISVWPMLESTSTQAIVSSAA